MAFFASFLRELPLNENFFSKPLNAQGKRTLFLIVFLAMSVRVAFVRKRIENA